MKKRRLRFLVKRRFSGGGGDRTRVSGDDSVLTTNDLRQCIQRLAALWLLSPDTDEHDVARIVTIAEAWSSMPEAIKIKVEALSQIQN